MTAPKKGGKLQYWKMIALEKGRILLDWKMAENVPPENDGMEMIAPEKNGIVQDQKMAENTPLENDCLGK